MVPEKPHGKRPARSPLSLASRMLGGAVHAPLPVPALEEPWRNKKKGKNRGRRRK
jgi:hypothetical protein